MREGRFEGPGGPEGEVNGDGFDDLIVGAFGDDNNGTDSGSARVFSGAVGQDARTWIRGRTP